MIHKLTAKAVIQDWLFGMMAQDKLEDEVMMMIMLMIMIASVNILINQETRNAFDLNKKWLQNKLNFQM